MSAIEFTHAEIAAEAAMLAYSIRMAEQGGDKDSAGWWELRGAFGYGLSVLGRWPDVLSPDAENEPEREAAFQALLDEFAARHA